MEDKNGLKQGFQVALAALVFQFFLAIAFYFLFTRLSSPLVMCEILHIVVGIPIFTLIFLLYQQKYRFALEKEEAEELIKKEGKIFDGEESSLLVSGIRLRQTERIIIPVVTVLLAVTLMYGAIKTIVLFHNKSLDYQTNPVISLLLIGLTFLIFLVSRYILGMGKRKLWKDLRIIGSYLGVNALFCFLTALSIAFHGFKLPKIEWFVFYLLSILLFIIGIEYALNIIASFYRSKKSEKRLPFDSRILLLLSTPEEIIPVFSEIVDYQFGFHITQTWFYQFIRKRIIPLLLIQAALLYLLTCFVIIKPYQRAFIEFLGKPVQHARVFGPGIHLKFPYPIGKMKIFDVDRVKSVRIGARGKEGARFLWTEKHYEEEFNWIIASKEEGSSISGSKTVPVNFLSVTMWIYYQINSDKLFDYVYKHAQPIEFLETIVYNQFTKMVMSVDFFEILTVKRLFLAEILKQQIQKEADKYHLGVKIVMVSMEGIHPPVEVASSFEKVVGATEKKESFILEADAYKNKELTLADYNASRIRIEADSYKFVRTVESKASGEKFRNELYAYWKSPIIFKYRHYLRVLDKCLINPKKYIILSSDRDQNVTILNLEKTALPDILSLGLEAEKEKKGK